MSDLDLDTIEAVHYETQGGRPLVQIPVEQWGTLVTELRRLQSDVIFWKQESAPARFARDAAERKLAQIRAMCDHPGAVQFPNLRRGLYVTDVLAVLDGDGV